MRFAAKYVVGLAILAAIDGALLSGVAAVITAMGGIVLGVMAYRRGRTNGGDGYRELAAELRRENRQLRDELEHRAER